MRYYTSEHFREDPYEEIDAALEANSPESIKTTLEARLLTEANYTPPSPEEMQRIEQQLAYVALFISDEVVAA